MGNMELLTEPRHEKEIYKWLEAGTCYMKGVQRHCLMKAKKVKGNMKDFFKESWWERSLRAQWDKGPGDKDSGKGLLQNALFFNSMIQTFWIYSVKKKESSNQQIKLQKNTIKKISWYHQNNQ